MLERTPVKPTEYAFNNAVLPRRIRKDHGMCEFVGTQKHGACITCTGKTEGCKKYESIQPFIPKADPHYSLDTEVAEPIAFALSEKGRDHLMIVGPPGCLSGDTIVRLRRGKRNSGRVYLLKEAWQNTIGTGLWSDDIPTYIQALHNDGSVNYHKISSIIYSGRKITYTIKTESGKTIRATNDHLFKTKNDYVPLCNLNVGDTLLCRNTISISNGGKKKVTHKRKTVICKYHPNGRIKRTGKYLYKEVYYSIIEVEAARNGIATKDFIRILKTDEKKSKLFLYLPKKFIVHHKDENEQNNDIRNLEIMTKNEHDKLHGVTNKKNFSNQIPIQEKIVSIEKYGEEDVYDISMNGEPRNFVADGFIVHNCGKSSLVMMIAAITDWECIRFSCSEETRLHQIIGQWIVAGDKMVWIDGYATDALRNGKILLEDEADFMRPELRGALHPILERDGTIPLQRCHPTTGVTFMEVVPRHPDFRWVSTANTIGFGDDSFQYHGTQLMNAAARDRYAIIVEMNYMEPEDEAEIIKRKTGVDEETALCMANVAAGMREMKKNKKTDYTFGLRRLLSWGKYHSFYNEFGTAHKAIRLSLLNFAIPKDREVIIKMIRTHGNHEWVQELERNNV